MKKRKWLLVNGCECKSPISVVVEYFNMIQDEDNASECSGILLENNDTFNAAMTSHLICMA
jgi:hypothetical protein